MGFKLIASVFKASLPSPIDKLVLLALANVARDDSAQAWASNQTLANMCDCSPRAVRLALRTIEIEGHVTRVERPGATTMYHVHPRANAAVKSRATPASRAAPPRHEMPPSFEATPASDAAHPGTSCRPPRHEVPDTPARGAAEPIREPITEPTIEPVMRARARMDADQSRFTQDPRAAARASARLADDDEKNAGETVRYERWPKLTIGQQEQVMIDDVSRTVLDGRGGEFELQILRDLVARSRTERPQIEAQAVSLIGQIRKQLADTKEKT